MSLAGFDIAGLDLGEISREIERQQEKRRYDWKLQARPKQLAPQGKYRYFVVMAGRGFGKALSLDTEVPTPSGWTTMGDIKVGDMLFDESGNPCNVTFITDVMHGRTCYDVVFDDGTVIVADAEHQWVTDTHASRKAKSRRVTGAVSSKSQCQRRKECDPAIRTTEQIKASLVYGMRERNHSIDVCGSLNLPDALLPIHPYAFGAWLGDGDSKSFTMTSADPEIIAEMVKSGCSFQDGKKDPRSAAVRYAVTSTAHKRDPVTGRSCSNGSMLSTLKTMGVFQNKHIPSVYLRGSVPQRMDLLCGLMDTDGYIQTNGNCEFTSTRKALADGAFELIAGLGFKATMKESVARLNGVNCGPKYRISFTPDRPVFRLPRKLARHDFTRAQKGRTRRRYIAEVRERQSVPVRCLTVDSPNHLFLASRSFVPTHNTRCGAEYIRQLAEGGKHPILHILGPTAADVRDVMIEGPSGILACSPPWFMPEYEPSKRQIKWPNGVIAKTFSAEEPNRLRGPQCYGGWIDEIAAFDDPEAFTQFKLGYRLGSDLRCIITTTPKPCPIIHDLVKDEKTGKAIIVRGSTYENRQNLAEDFFADVISQYEGTRLGRQELEGELLEDTPGALWNTLLIDRTRVKREDLPPMARIVVAIDPSVTSNARSDECGIAVVGKGVNGDGYMLEDLSGVMTPNEWAMAAIAAYHRHSADVIVGETNNGGDLVGNTILALDPGVPFRKVTASRGKHLRAEPISLLSEQGRFHLVGNFPKLEEQLVAMASDGYTGPGSPDRCFVAGTMIQTANGQVPIENVRVGDLVHTRRGLRPVIASGKTNAVAQVNRVEFDGGSLTGTGNHPVFVAGKGFTCLDSLVCGDIIKTWKTHAESPSTGLRSTATRKLKTGRTGFTSSRTRQRAKRAGLGAFIGIYGGRLTEQYQQASSSITLMATRLTMNRGTWNALRESSTPQNTRWQATRKFLPTLPISVHWPQRGISRRMDGSGIESTAGKRTQRLSHKRQYVFGAGPNALGGKTKNGFAPESALGFTTGRWEPTTSQLRVRYAGKSTAAESTQRSHRSHALRSVLRLSDAGTAQVYNLTVADAHEYYANGVLVHNCDAMVWGASEVMLGGTTVQMFPDFRAAHRGNGEPAQAVHVVDMGDLKDWWTRWISVTMGSSSAAHWWCREPAQPGKVGSRSRIYREFLAQDMTPEEFGAQIAQRSQQEAKISRILPVWLTESAFSGIQGKSVAAAVAEGIQRSLGQHKAFLFVHDDEERGIVDPQQRWRTFSARMDRMPTGFLSVQPIKGKDSDGWDVVREMLRWRPAASGRLEGPDWDYARQLVLTDYPAYERYISEFKEPDVEVLPELLISNQCKGVIQAMSGAVRTNDDSALAMGGGSFVLQSLRIGALASREDASREPMQEFVGRKLAALPSGASGTARHMAAMKAEQDWGGQHGMGPISFSRKRK
jgi:phage terminase large subunit-like protein